MSESALKTRITEAMKAAMRAQDKPRRDAIRLIQADVILESREVKDVLAHCERWYSIANLFMGLRGCFARHLQLATPCIDPAGYDAQIADRRALQ